MANKGTKRSSSPGDQESGFTLLEVMIAVAIMVVAFASILMVQSNSLQASIKAKELNIASMLLKQQMIATEAALEGKAASELKKEESGAFKDPYQDYSWKREIKEVKFPNIASLANAAPAEGSESGSSSSSTTSSGAAGSTTEQISRLVTNFLSKALREVTVTVSWKKGKSEQKAAASLYWVDLNSAFQLTE